MLPAETECVTDLALSSSASTTTVGRPAVTARALRVLRAHPWLTWALTRGVGAALACTALLHNWAFGTDGLAGDVLHTYMRAHASLVQGHVPYRDFSFEYPPGSLPFLYLPGDAGIGRFAFLLTYMSQMLVVDAAIHRLLRRGGGPTAVVAADLWLYGGALTGGLLLCRNDLPACLAVVAGLLALRSGRSVRAAALFAVGALVKVWPAELLMLLLGCGRRWRRSLLAAAGVAVAALAPFVVLGALPGMIRDIVGYHGSRGVEIEAVAALPQVLVAALTGRSVPLSYDHGSSNLAHSAVLADACTIGGVLVAGVAVGWIIWQRRRGPVAYESLVLLALWLVGANLVVTKVFSPQYMLWLLAVAVVAVSAGILPHLDQQLLLGAMLATTLEYPFDFLALGQGGALSVAPAVFLLVRDALLIFLVARWTRRLAHGSRLET